jgi:hypothetical protein
MTVLAPTCFRCGLEPSSIAEYRDTFEEQGYDSPDAFARDDGTYNRTSNHFCCTSCYIAIGMPASKEGWKAP